MPAYVPLKEKDSTENNDEEAPDVIIPAIVASVILVIIRNGSNLIFSSRT